MNRISITRVMVFLALTLLVVCLVAKGQSERPGAEVGDGAAKGLSKVQVQESKAPGQRWALLIFAGAWVIYTLSSTLFVPGVSQAGHLGGIVAGGLAGWLLVDGGAQLRSEASTTVMVAALLVVLFAAAVLV